jgi:hypothetical protein
MPEKETLERAREDREEGKSASTQAGEFVREEIHHVREGKHGARSPQQAIAIGLSKARRAGVPLKPPKSSRVSPRTRRQSERDTAKGRRRRKKAAPKRSRATKSALKRESRRSTSPGALSRQTRRASRRRTHQERSAAAKKAARTRASRRRRRR